MTELVLVGNPGEVHVGAHLLNAAWKLQIVTVFCDLNDAYEGNKIIRKFNWWLRGRRPTNLQSFSAKIVNICKEHRPKYLISTGIAPLEEKALKELGRIGVSTINYLTDDPWNRAHSSPWFIKAVNAYKYIFTPRRSNIDDLVSSGCRNVSYLPFAYAPELHYPEELSSKEDHEKYHADVVFVVGADKDRVGYISFLIKAGFSVSLWGGYWERFKETRDHARGHLKPSLVRKAIAGAKVALCLVRRANRDGQCMRTFEVPAMGGCMLTEDTQEHREIFGEEGAAVMYFQTVEEMIAKLRWLLENESERSRLSLNASNLIVKGNNTYQDRLETMLKVK